MEDGLNEVPRHLFPHENNEVLQQVRKVVIFASGAGSNAQKILEYFRNSTTIKIVLLVCNKPGAGVLAIAREEHLPVLMIDKERFFRGDGYVRDLQNKGTDLIVLAGFLWKIPSTLIQAFPRQIINLHPALLPRYGGKGMYGHFVHESVLASGDPESGITIHFVNEKYDEGELIFQSSCRVNKSDSPGDLAARIQQLEHRYYPRVIEQLLESKEAPKP